MAAAEPDWVVAMGALLFVPAGTLHWPAAWVFLATSAVIGTALVGGWPKPTRRCSPSGCARCCEDQPAADKKFMLVFGVSR